MRVRLALIMMMFATIGCTRDNPAFGESTGTGETTTTGDGDPTTLETAEADSDSGQEAPDPVCELEGGVQLQIDLGPAGCADSPETYDRLHRLVMIEGGTLWVGTCPQGSNDCSLCETDIPTPLSFDPLDLTGLALDGSCLYVHARRTDPTNPDACRFQSVVIEAAEGVSRRALMIGKNEHGVTLPPLDNSSPLVGFDPMPVEVDDCSCAEYPDACCGDIATTVYALDIGDGQPVAIGDSRLLVYPNATYEFKALDAFQPGECGQPMRESWSAIGI